MNDVLLLDERDLDRAMNAGLTHFNSDLQEFHDHSPASIVADRVEGPLVSLLSPSPAADYHSMAPGNSDGASSGASTVNSRQDRKRRRRRKTSAGTRYRGVECQICGKISPCKAKVCQLFLSIGLHTT